MNNKDWWKPSVLKQSEKNISVNDSLNELDTLGDFGSYKMMLKTNDITKSNVNIHNELNPKYRVSILKSILGSFSPKTIIDVGCGLGFTTNEIKCYFPNTKVVGIDISTDAVKYAEKHFKSCEFISEAIDPSEVNKYYSADLICAFEFYPFTRTNKIEDHKEYLIYLMNWLNEGGKLVIFQLWDNKGSLSVNFDSLKKDFTSWEFLIFDIPMRKINSLIKNLVLANLISKILRTLIRTLTGRIFGRSKMIVIEKN